MPLTVPSLLVRACAHPAAARQSACQKTHELHNMYYDFLEFVY